MAFPVKRFPLTGKAIDFTLKIIIPITPYLQILSIYPCREPFKLSWCYFFPGTTGFCDFFS